MNSACLSVRPLFTKVKTSERTFTGQSISPLAPIGVDAALEAAKDASLAPKPKIFNEFALTDRVGIVSGGNRGLGLEMALALCEAGARAIYCLSVSDKPSDEWIKTRDFVKRLGSGSRLEYVSVDVRNQKEVWEISERIGENEKRMDMCVAAAGVLKPHGDCLTYPAEEFEEVMDVNTNGVLYTAQGAGQQMRKFGNGGSIILIASKSGSLANKVSSKKLWVKSVLR
jgi:NAD(P)-dependent dehydrogenase (short-subunit alcohol dehydrogenase family)